MLNKPYKLDTYELISRQIGHLMQQGLRYEDAAKRLQSLGDEELKRDVEVALTYLSADGPSADDDLDGTSLGTLRKLSRVAAKYSVPSGGLLQHVSSVFGSLTEGYRVYWAGIGGMMLYVGMLFLLAIAAISIYTVFVYPQFREIFQDSNTSLPPLTQMLMDLSPFHVYVVLAASGAVVVFLGIIASSVRSNIKELRPIGGLLLRIPGIASVGATYNALLAAKCALLLARAGVPARSAVTEAWYLIEAESDPAASPPEAEATSISAKLLRSPIAGRIALAQALDTVELELESLLQEAEAIFAARLIRVREDVTLGAQIAAALLVSTLVIGMYLPIFKMGSIV